MKKNFIFGTIIFTIFLIALMISVSFAWYAAKTNQGNIDLLSEGITITFNETDDKKLQPLILKEGVVYKDSQGNYQYPSDYPDDKYFVSKGNTLTYEEKIEVYLNESTAKMLFSISYKDKKGEIVSLDEADMLNYFDLQYSIGEDELTPYTGSVTLSELDGEYDLKISISYKLPDELLPSDLVNSDFIVISAKAYIK